MPNNSCILYQDLYVSAEYLIKKYLLTYDNIKTIIPKEYYGTTKYHENFNTCSDLQFDFELYKKVNNCAQSEVVDYFVIPETDRKELLDIMFNFLDSVVSNKSLYNSLKSGPKRARFYWILGGEIEKPLVELLLEYELAVLLARPELPIRVANLFSEIVGSYIKNKYSFDMIPSKITGEMYDENIFKENDIEILNKRIVSTIIPDIYLQDLIEKTPLNEFFKIRNDLLPLRRKYLNEIEEYRDEINLYMNKGNEQAAFELLNEFHIRVNESFQRYSSLVHKTVKFMKKTKVGLVLNGLTILFGDMLKSAKYYDYLQLFFALFNASIGTEIESFGFDYLIELQAKLKLRELKRNLNIFM